MIIDSTPLSGVWSRAVPELARSLARPEIVKSVAWIHGQLAKLADDPELGDAFDRRLAQLAAALREKGVLTTNPQHPERSQGVGFLLAAYAATHKASDPLYPVFIAQLDRRAQGEGKVHCKWRGYVPEREYDAWRWDDYQRRVKLANTGEKERAA